MSKLIVKMSVSVDGCAAPSGGDTDWIFPSMSADALDWIAATVAPASAHLLGRTAYQDMARYWPTATGPIADAMNQTPKVVFSRTLRTACWAGARIAANDPAAEIAALRRESGGPLVAHGGVGFVRSLADADLVDEYHLLVHPVVLGDGLRPFGRRAAWRLCSSRAFAAGTLGNVYAAR